MIVLGLVLLVLGLLFGIGLLTWLGVVLMIIGAVLWAAGSAGHAVGGRSHWY